MSGDDWRKYVVDPTKMEVVWIERDGLLVLDEIRREGWKPGGPHGAKCYGGPLDGKTVLVNSRESDQYAAEWTVGVRDHDSGVYEFGYGPPTTTRIIGTHRIGGLYWRPHPVIPAGV